MDVWDVESGRAERQPHKNNNKCLFLLEWILQTIREAQCARWIPAKTPFVAGLPELVTMFFFQAVRPSS